MRQKPRKNLCPSCPFKNTCHALKQEAELESADGGVFFMPGGEIEGGVLIPGDWFSFIQVFTSRRK